MQIFLASASPRRKDLLSQVGIEYTVRVADIDETISEKIPSKVVEELSKGKAAYIAKQLDEEGVKEYCVIGADTIVSIEDQIMGKPADTADAERMLKKLSGNTHQVYTGVTLCVRKSEVEYSEVVFHEKTDVTMYELSEKQIEDYIATKEPMDKAGAYGIQERAAAFVKGICGEYSNVVGLPVGRLVYELKRLQIL